MRSFDSNTQAHLETGNQRTLYRKVRHDPSLFVAIIRLSLFHYIPVISVASHMKFDFLNNALGWLKSRRESRRSLNHILSGGVGLALLCTICLALVIVTRSYFDFNQAQRNYNHLQAYRVILDAANIVSAERGPANTSMAVDPNEPEAKTALAGARARTDAAFTQVTTLADEYAVPSATMNEIYQLLASGRLAVDKVAAMPRQDRNLEIIEQAVHGMFAIVDRLTVVVDRQAGQLMKLDATLAGPAIVGRSLGELREYGGRLGSLLLQPIAIGLPVSPSIAADIRRTEGRIAALWDIIKTVPDLSEPRFRQDKLDVENLFFGNGLNLVHTLIAQSDHLDYSIDSPAFTARYVPTMRPLETLRANYLNVALQRAAQARDRDLSLLLIGALAAIFVISLLIGIITIIRREVFRPLLKARHEILRLVEDRSTAASSPTHVTHEMEQLFTAIGELQDKLAERKLLTDRLQELAETDSLTGLANRRLLDLVGQGADDSRFVGGSVGLILLDIDHFKAINDTHGHLIGDQMLIEMADLLRATLRSGDLIARYGGEEFAILVRDGNMQDLLSLARKIRQVVQAHLFGMIDDIPLRLTVSCGVANGERSTAGWVSLVKDADDALYRAKSEGRNSVRQASGEDESTPTRSTLSS